MPKNRLTEATDGAMPPVPANVPHDVDRSGCFSQPAALHGREINAKDPEAERRPRCVVPDKMNRWMRAPE